MNETPTDRPAGSVVLSRDGRTAYRVQKDGSWTKLPALEASKYREEFKRRQAKAAEVVAAVEAAAKRRAEA